MNAVTPFEPTLDTAVWDRATRAANQWRSEAIDVLAQGEALVTEMLLTLHAVHGRGTQVKLRQLLGQRLADLHDAIKTDGPFATEGKCAVTRLAKFREHESLRATLCHGVATVALDRQRRWIMVIKLAALDSSGAKRTKLVIDGDEAAPLLAELQADVRNLRSAMGQITAALKSTTVAKAPQQPVVTAA